MHALHVSFGRYDSDMVRDFGRVATVFLPSFIYDKVSSRLLTGWGGVHTCSRSIYEIRLVAEMAAISLRRTSAPPGFKRTRLSLRAKVSSIEHRRFINGGRAMHFYLFEGISRIKVNIARNSLAEPTVPRKLRCSSVHSSRSVTL